ncbi:MAG: TonB-dependent receptor, partial [Verrucomicrobiota bacterium]
MTHSSLRSVFLRKLLLATSCIALVGTSFAQTNGASDFTDIEVAELDTTVITTSTFEPTTPVIQRPVIIDQTVTTPTRTEKKISEIPSAVGVITENDIARIAPLSFDDLIRTEPNVDTFGGPRYLGEQIVIRGQGGNSVTVRIDDARQNFVSGHAGQRFFVEPHFLKEVEILKGGGSYLYGSGAAGVVSLTTLDPVDIIKDGKSFGLRIRNEYHTNSSEWANSVLGAVSSENLDFMIGTSGRDANDITLPDGSELAGSAYERNSNIAKMVIRPGVDQQLSFTVSDYQSLDQGGANPAQFEIDAINDPGNNAPVGRDIDYIQWTGNYQWNPIENDLIDLNATIYYNTTKQTRNYLDTTTANAARRNVHDFSVFGIDLRNRSIVQFGNLEHELVYGLEYIRETQDGQETRDQFFIGGVTNSVAGIPGNSSGRPDAEGDHIAFYLTDEIELTDDFTLFAGLRYDAYENEQTIGGNLTQSDGALSPNIGFNYEVDENWSVSAQYSRAFTAPTLNDIYQNGSHFGVVPNDPFFVTVVEPQGGFFFPTFTAPPPGQVNVNYFEEIFIPN